MDVFDGWKQTIGSVIPIYKKLIDAKLRILVYSGDTDGRVLVLSTRYNLSYLGLPITKAWRPWYNQKQVGGWAQEYEGLTFATFRGAVTQCLFSNRVNRVHSLFHFFSKSLHHPSIS